MHELQEPPPWRLAKVKDLSVIRRGASPRPIDDPTYFANQGRGWIRISDVTAAYKTIASTEQYLSKRGVDRSVAVEPGQLIMSICATIGKPVIVGVPCCIHDGFVLFDRLSDDIDTDFLFYQLVKKQAEIVKNRQVGTQGNLNIGLVNDLELLVPPKCEQLMVAKILDTLDTTIRQTESIIEKLKQVKQGLLHDLLTRGIDANGELRPPQSQAPHLYKASPLGWIPRDWGVMPIAALVRQVTYGFTNPMPTTTEGPWMLTAADIADGRIDYSTARKTAPREFARLSRKSRPSEGDILVTKDGTLGRVALLDRDGVCVNQSVAVLSPLEAGPGAFLALYLRSPRGQDRMVADAGGSTIKHIYITTLANMLVPGPPTTEASEIWRHAGALEQRIQLEASELSKLGTLKSGLMDDLLTGRVRVTPLLA